MACANDKGLKKVHCASGTRTVGINWEESCKRLRRTIELSERNLFEKQTPLIFLNLLRVPKYLRDVFEL